MPPTASVAGGGVARPGAESLISRPTDQTEADMRRCSIGLIGFCLSRRFSPPARRAQATDGAYRGTIVCSQLKKSNFVLRDRSTPDQRQDRACRAPIFNLTARVIGSEIATGTVSEEGTQAQLELERGRCELSRQLRRQHRRAGRHAQRKPSLDHAGRGRDSTCTAAFVQIKS